MAIGYRSWSISHGKHATLPCLFCSFHNTTRPVLLAPPFISYQILARLSLVTFTYNHTVSTTFTPQNFGTRKQTRMRPSLYITLCLLSLSPSEATLISRTAHRIHHAAVKRSSRFARDIRSVFSNVLIENPIIDTGNKVYCVVNTGNGQDPTSSTMVPTSGGNPVIVSSITSVSSSSKHPTPTSSSRGSPAPTPTSPWTLVETRAGASFFDGWDFWSLAGVFSRSFVGNHRLILFL